MNTPAHRERRRTGRLAILFALSLVAGADAAAPGGGAGPEVSVVAVNPQLQPKEPLRLKVVTANPTAEPLSFTPSVPTTVTLSTDGGEATNYHLFRTLKSQVSEVGVAPAELAPGAVHEEAFWLLLGGRDLNHEWEFLLAAPGAYHLEFSQPEGAELDVTVTAGSGEEGGLFTVGAAAILLGESQREDGPAGLQALQQIVADHPAGRFAPYANLALAEREWAQHGTPGYDAAACHAALDRIIQSNHFLREEAMFLQARAWVHEGRKDQVAAVAAQLAQAFPTSPFLGRIQTEFGVAPGQTFPARQPAVPPSAAPATLELTGLDGLPQAAADKLTAYWQALAARDLDAAGNCLGESFLGDDGDRHGWRSRWDWTWANHNIDKLIVAGTNGRALTTYTRPSVLAAERRTWDGELAAVELTVTYQATQIWTGETIDTAGPPVTTVLRMENGEWTIVSEYSEPSANLKLSTLVMDLNRRLTATPGEVSVSDGTSERSIGQELVAAAVHGEALLSWQLVGLEMTGADMDVARLTGTATVGDASGANAVRHTAVLELGLLNDALQLRSLELNDGP